jgi:hypothetical protein
LTRLFRAPFAPVLASRFAPEMFWVAMLAPVTVVVGEGIPRRYQEKHRKYG